MRAAQGVRTASRPGPPAFAPVILLGQVMPLFIGDLDVGDGRDSIGLKLRRLRRQK